MGGPCDSGRWRRYCRRIVRSRRLPAATTPAMRTGPAAERRAGPVVEIVGDGGEIRAAGATVDDHRHGQPRRCGRRAGRGQRHGQRAGTGGRSAGHGRRQRRRRPQGRRRRASRSTAGSAAASISAAPSCASTARRRAGSRPAPRASSSAPRPTSPAASPRPRPTSSWREDRRSGPSRRRHRDLQRQAARERDARRRPRHGRPDGGDRRKPRRAVAHRAPVIAQGAKITGKTIIQEPRFGGSLPRWMWKAIFAAVMAAGTVLAGVILIGAARGRLRRRARACHVPSAIERAHRARDADPPADRRGAADGDAHRLVVRACAAPRCIPFLIVAGHTVAATCIGVWIFDRTGEPRSAGRLFLYLLAGAIVMALVWLIPWAGPTIVWLAILVGTGAWIRSVSARLRRRSAVA